MADASSSDRLWRDIQTCLMGFVHNWDLSRAYAASRAMRTQGFTEKWGSSSKHIKTTMIDNDSGDDDDDEDHPGSRYEEEDMKQEDCWQREEDFVTKSLVPASLSSSSSSSSLSFSVTVPDDSALSPCLLTFYQYRPCWCEQLACRVTGLAHVVVNQPYAVSEVTGPLPMLLDLVPPTAAAATAAAIGDNKAVSKQIAPPVVMGRENRRRGISQKAINSTAPPFLHHGYHNNDILLYLKQSRGMDLNEHVLLLQNSPDEQQQLNIRAQSLLLQSLICGTLHDCLVILRYKDRQAWEQVNRRQCLKAAAAAAGGGYCWNHDGAANNDGNKQRRRKNEWLGFSGLWQTRSERLHALSRLSSQQAADTWSVEQAIHQAKVAYRILEMQMQTTAAAAAAAATAAANNNSDGSSSGKVSPSYCLLHPTKVTLVDVLLWDHLANALADVHLVTVLAEFPRLCRFAEYIWETYFSVDSNNTGGTNTDTTNNNNKHPAEPWQLWNAAENARNAFCQIPFLPSPVNNHKDLDGSMSGITPGHFHDAVQLMETLSVTSLKLQERLALGAKMRHEEKIQALQYSSFAAFQQQQNTSSTPPTSTTTGKRQQAATQQAAAAKAYQYADQVWLATVVLATIVGMAAGITGAARK